MTVWIVLGCVTLAVVLLWRMPVGAKVAYDHTGVALAVSVGPVTVPVYPRPKRRGKKLEKKKKKQRQSQQSTLEQTEKTSPRSLGSWKKFRDYLPLVCQAAGELRRKILVRQLEIHLIWAGEDPASAAIGYGVAHGVMGGLWNLVEASFQVGSHNIKVELDYERKKPQVSAKAALCLRLGQAVGFAIRYGMKIAGIQREKRRETQTSKEVNDHE